MATAQRMTDTLADDLPSADWWTRLDDTCERFGDALNPILVKETRQALKSRQFVLTFSVLLFAALAWTIIGSLMSMPQIYTTPSAPRLLIGYYIVLAIPMLLVVPLAAYRSLEGEIDDGTLEMLQITALSPWQIVLGKLASASLQMLLYFVPLLPCVAYAYTLRGVDLPTTLLMVAVLLVGALILTVIALFFAPLARTRTGRIATLLSVMLILLVAEYGIGALVIGMILYGNPLSTYWVIYIVVATLLISASLGHLLLTAAAAQLTPESENRSTRIRISLMILSGVLIGLTTYALESLTEESAVVFFCVAAALAVLWTLCGSMMAAESPVMTPRIRRELPNSFLARLGLTWLTPGPGTGLVFASANIVILTALVILAMRYYFTQPAFGPSPISANVLNIFTQFAVLFAAYLIGFLVIVRFVVAVVRINNHPRVEIGLAALIAVAVLSSLVPYSIGLHWNDYRPFDYSRWQITNWVWTTGELFNRRVLNFEVIMIASFVAVLFFVSMLLVPQAVLPRRTATPMRVRAELNGKNDA